MDLPIQVHTTTPDEATATAIAQALVEHRLAACVQVSGPIKSTYRWEGKIECAEEWMCCAKTVRRLYPQVEMHIRQAHPYEEPEILMVDVAGGSRGYLAWLVDQLIAPPAAVGKVAVDERAV